MQTVYVQSDLVVRDVCETESCYLLPSMFGIERFGTLNLPDSTEIQVHFGTWAIQHDEVRRVRQYGLGESVQTDFEFDKWSYHYTIAIQTKIIATVTVTRQEDGELDCWQHYPNSILTAYSNKLCTVVKLRMLPIDHTPGVNRLTLIKFIVRMICGHQLSIGTRLAIVNATGRFEHFYRRLGFHALPEFRFKHPTLHTDSCSLIMPSDVTTAPTYLSDIIRFIPDAVLLSDVQQTLNDHVVAVNH